MTPLDMLPAKRCSAAALLLQIIDGCPHRMFYLNTRNRAISQMVADLEAAGIVGCQDAGVNCVKVVLLNCESDCRPGTGNHPNDHADDKSGEIPF